MLVATLVAVWYGALPDEPQLSVVIGAAVVPGLLVGLIFSSTVGRVGPGAWATVLAAVVVATALGALLGRVGVRQHVGSAVAITLLVFAGVSFVGDLVSEAVGVGRSATALLGTDAVAAVLATVLAVLLGRWRLFRLGPDDSRALAAWPPSRRTTWLVALSPALLSAMVLVLTLLALLTVHRPALGLLGLSWLAAPLLWLCLGVLEAAVGLTVVALTGRHRASGSPAP